jgi:predicted dehydrogenase
MDEDTISGSLIPFGEGRLASVAANNIAHDSRAPQMELFGLAGTVSVNLLDVAAPVDIYRPALGWQSIALDHARAGSPDHLLGVEHLIACITTGQPPLPSINHAIHVIEVMEAAAQSTATGRAVELSSTAL